MADAFGLAMQIVDITIKIVHYVQDTKNALTEIASFAEVASYATGVVQSLRCVGEKAPEGTACRNDIKSLFEGNGIGKKYYDLLKEFQKGLEPVQKEHKFAIMAKAEEKSQRWKWSFKKDDTEKLMRRLQEYQNLLISSQQNILIAMMNSSDAATAASLTRIEANITRAKGLLESSAFRNACDELSVVDVSARVRYNVEQARGSRPRWVLEAAEMKAWAANGRQDGESISKRVLWASGDSGTGKSTIAAVVIDNVSSRTRGDSAVISFFCVLLEGKSRTADTIMRSLARQLLEQLVTKDESSLDAALESLNNEYANSKLIKDQEEGLLGHETDEGASESSLKELRSSHLLNTQDYVYFIHHLLHEVPVTQVVEILLAEFQSTYCILDALDELWNDKEDREQLDELMIRLEELAQRVPSLKLVIFSQKKISACFSEPSAFATVTRMDIAAKEDNIMQYALLRMKTKQRSRRQVLSQLSEDEQRAIALKVANKSDGQFLNAVRHMAAITGRSRLSEVDEYLMDMSSDLGQNADKAISRIQEQDEYDRLLGMHALMWTVCSKRPLRINELKHALAMYSMRLGGEFDRHAIPDDEAILGSCEVLLDLNRELGTVETHRSLYDYFCNDDRQKIKEHFPNAAEEMTSICLSYLSCATFSQPHGDYDRMSKEMPLVQYAALYWGVHVREAGEDNVTSKVFDLFGKPVNSLWAGYFAWQQASTKAFESLGLPSTMGFQEAATEAAQLKVDSPRYQSSCLQLAAFFGLYNITETLLLEHYMNVDAVYYYHRQRPLTAAIFRGHADTTKLLLQQGADAHMRSANSCTYLHLAATVGHPEVIQALLDHRGDLLNIADDRGKTPLFLAAEGGQEAAVRVLLNNKADATLSDKGKRPALHRAIRAGNDRVVQAFRDILGPEALEIRNPDWDDTALNQAAVGNILSAAELLIKLGVDLESRQKQGKTSVHLATEWGSYDVLNLLLRKGAKAFDRTSQNQETPLLLAVSRGHFDNLRLLLSYEEARAQECLNAQNIYGDTPVWLAAQHGKFNFLRLLLDYDPDITIPNNRGDTVLHSAMRRQMPEMLQFLLGLERARQPDMLNSRNQAGETPLFCAVNVKCFDGVRMLLDVGADISIVNHKYFDTPIIHAVENNTPANVLDEFLGHPNVKREHLDHENWYKDTALSLAIRDKKLDRVKVLRAHGASTDNVNKDGRSIRQRAEDWGNAEALKVLGFTK